MADIQKNAVLLSHDLLPILEDLIDSGNAYAAAELTVSILKYDRDGIEPDFTDKALAFVWRTVIKPKLDEYREKYIRRTEARRENGAKGGRPKKAVEPDISEDEEDNPKNQEKLNNQENQNKPCIDKISIVKISNDKKEKINKKEKP